MFPNHHNQLRQVIALKRKILDHHFHFFFVAGNLIEATHHLLIDGAAALMRVLG